MMIISPPQYINLTIADAFILFVMELMLIVFLSPKLKFREVWESILIINLLKVGLISLIIPVFVGSSIFEFNMIENYFILLLISGFIISMSILRKELSFSNEQVILNAFITTFLSSSFWKAIYLNSSSIYTQPYFLTREVIARDFLATSGDLTNNFINIFGLLPFFLLGIIFYLRQRSKSTQNPTIT